MKLPKSPYEKEGGLIYFPRMLDKIRLNLKGELPDDYLTQLGKGLDMRCCRFLRVDYDRLVQKVESGLSDGEILEWSFIAGRKPGEDEKFVWNNFMIKLGWRDENPDIAKRVEAYKKASGLEERDDIITVFDYIEVDEKRRP